MNNKNIFQFENNCFVDHNGGLYKLEAFQSDPNKKADMMFKISYYISLILFIQTALSHDLDHEKVFNVISRLFTDLSKSSEQQRVAILYNEKQNDLVEKLVVKRFAEGLDLTLVTDLKKLSQAEFSMIVVFVSNTNLVSHN